MLNRRALIIDAAQAASDARDRVGFDLIAPIDVYDLAERLGVRVLFLDVSMEGFYQKGPPSRILLSAQRPLARRAFTCAHEIGHHWFGHGSTGWAAARLRQARLDGSDRGSGPNSDSR
jgi:Zn-dependent peptidase ImmA (M78 family)